MESPNPHAMWEHEDHPDVNCTMSVSAGEVVTHYVSPATVATLFEGSAYFYLEYQGQLTLNATISCGGGAYGAWGTVEVMAPDLGTVISVNGTTPSASTAVPFYRYKIRVTVYAYAQEWGHTGDWAKMTITFS